MEAEDKVDEWLVGLPFDPAHEQAGLVVVTRESAVPVLSSVVCALITSTFHDHVAEVEVGDEEGLSRSCAINCDNLFTLPKQVLTRQRGHLGPAKLAQLDRGAHHRARARVSGGAVTEGFPVPSNISSNKCGVTGRHPTSSAGQGVGQKPRSEH